MTRRDMMAFRIECRAELAMEIRKLELDLAARTRRMELLAAQFNSVNDRRRSLVHCYQQITARAHVGVA